MLAIGLDAIDPTLLMRWCDSGDLPVLRALRERGAWGPLEGPAALADDAAWATLYTGVSPARHGRFHWRRLRADSYEYPLFQDADLLHEPFWDTLSRQGYRVGVLDVPKTSLSSTINGFHVTDWRVHGRSGPTRSTPPEVAAELLARYGDDRTDCVHVQGDWLCREDQLDAADQATLLERLLESVSAKRDAANELLRDGPYDLFVVVFKEAHCAGHQFWSLLDAEHPLHDASVAARLQDPLKRVYRALDAAIGTLINDVPSDTRVLVFSDIGMSTNVTANPFLDEILFRLEYGDGVRPLGLRRIRWQLQRWHQSARARVARSRVGRLVLRGEHTAEQSRRKAFSLEHNEISGAIRLNIADREPSGRLANPREARAYAAYLERELLALRNVDTGESVVEAVHYSERAFAGPHADALPDLLIEWRRDAPIHCIQSDTCGVINGESLTHRSGNHVVGGLFIAAGPGIPTTADACPSALVDVAPTLAGWLGGTLPGVDGSSIFGGARHVAARQGVVDT